MKDCVMIQIFSQKRLPLKGDGQLHRVNNFMQLFREKQSSVLRPTLLKLSSHTTMATEDDTLLDSISENSSSGSPQMVDSVISESWTDLNENDVEENLPSPPLSEIIERAVVVLEKHIGNVMNWRAKKISDLAAVTASAHGGNSCTNAQTVSAKDSRTDSITLDDLQRKELVQFISTIASMYNNVLYHNFEHASHVLASSDSLIQMLQTNDKRVTASGSGAKSQSTSGDELEASEEKRHHLTTFGISSCPMTHLALIFSALVHDVEHQGVGNKQLIEENDVLAQRYAGKSVAENNSLDVSLDLLHQDCYSNLRKCMFGDKENSTGNARIEMEHDELLFQHVILNVIQATDISSQDRLEINKKKWKRAFEDTNSRSRCCCQLQVSRQTRRGSAPPPFTTKSKASSRSRRLSLSLDIDERSPTCTACTTSSNECLVHINYLRASSVLEQLIQAADVAHSMQCWPIFLKWNAKLYDELWAAKLAGRGADVSEVWFKGQIGFFDNYIMPLAKRLGQCGVFGELGTLFLENATENRTRWLDEGEERCKEMHERVLRLQGDATQS